jgi:glycosyltransferase involved in cell wall biosynthesis
MMVSFDTNILVYATPSAPLAKRLSGLPVVVTPEVGAAEIVRTSGAGLVVAGDLEPLSSAIRLLTADLVLARKMGEAGRQHAAAHFSWDHIAAQMEVLYTSLRS